MAETSSPSVGGTKSRQQKDLTDLDMAAAAQQLMQLSEEEEDSNDNKKKKTKKSDSDNNENHGGEVNSAKNMRILQGESFRPKKRRYRSMVHIYMATKPLNVIHGKKIRS